MQGPDSYRQFMLPSTAPPECAGKARLASCMVGSPSGYLVNTSSLARVGEVLERLPKRRSKRHVFASEELL